MHAEYDCPWQSASGAQSGTSPSRIEGFREFEADLSALFCKNEFRQNIYGFRHIRKNREKYGKM